MAHIVGKKRQEEDEVSWSRTRLRLKDDIDVSTSAKGSTPSQSVEATTDDAPLARLFNTIRFSDAAEAT